MKKFILPFASISLLITSCKKESETERQILLKNKWRLDSMVINGLPQQLPGCSTDNFYQFQEGGQGLYDEGAAKCSQDAPQVVPFTWAISEAPKIISVNLPGKGALNYHILKLLDGTLEYEYVYQNATIREVLVKH